MRSNVQSTSARRSHPYDVRPSDKIRACIAIMLAFFPEIVKHIFASLQIIINLPKRHGVLQRRRFYNIISGE